MDDITYFPLNEDVKAELLDDFELYLCYCLFYRASYDGDIEPLHNPDYVKYKKEQEAEELVKVKARLQEIRGRYNKELLTGK